jgi:uncharacterized RDD family membrane protein YckC
VRWTGEWLPGQEGAPAAGDGHGPHWPGERLGLPADGVGAIATGGARLGALLIDLVLAGLITFGFLHPNLQDTAAMQAYNLWAGGVWASLSAVAAALFGFTPGMAATGVRVARLDGASAVGVWRAVVRAVLTFVIIPAAVRNADGRSWLDRATGTVVVRMR